MRRWIGLLVAVLLVAPPPAARDRRAIVAQDGIGDIACGPCSLFNWLSHGGDELQAALVRLSSGRAPEATVRDTYTYRLTSGRAVQTTNVRTGRPLLEFRSSRYASPDSPRSIFVAHFATFAAGG